MIVVGKKAQALKQESLDLIDTMYNALPGDTYRTIKEPMLVTYQKIDQDRGLIQFELSGLYHTIATQVAFNKIEVPKDFSEHMHQLSVLTDKASKGQQGLMYGPSFAP